MYFLFFSETCGIMYKKYTIVTRGLRNSQGYWKGRIWRGLRCPNARFGKSVRNEDTEQMGNVEASGNSLLSRGKGCFSLRRS